MKIRTFWLILLKIVGFFLAIQGVQIVIYSLGILAIATTASEIIPEIISAIFFVLVYFFILWLFIFKTSWLVETLNLEKDFEDEKLEIDTHLSNILPIAIIVVGGIMIINSIPQFFKEIFSFYQQKITWNESRTVAWIVLYFLKAVLGYILMTNSKQITRFIIKRTSEENQDDNSQNELIEKSE